MLVKERKGALICLRYANEERAKNWDFDMGVLNSHNAFVVARMIKGFMYVEHIDNDNCWFHGFINIDPNFSFIPDWVINFTVKRVLYVIIGKM